MMWLDIKGVTKTYGSQKALNNVSFSVSSPGILGFLGPNGAGKSTMMKIITGFLPYDSGRVEVLGMDVSVNPTQVKRRIGYLPEHNPLYPDMYVKEFLDFCVRLYQIKNPLKKVRDIIGRVGLEKEMHKKIRALSKGYKQRVGLAQAIIHNPEIIILDEPTSGLDPNQVVEIRNLIKEISKEKLVMLSTHIMQEVEILCTSVIIIHQGNIVAEGTPEWLREHLSGHWLELETEEEITLDFSSFPEITYMEKPEKNKILFQVHSSIDIRKKIFDYCIRHRLTVLSLQKKERKMEEVFRLLTKN